MSAERRASFRFLVRPELKAAKLSWRGQSLAVELIDQSATGFSFKAPKNTDVKLNEVVSFRSWAGDCEALVVRLAENRDCLRIGIERTTDLVDPDSRRRWLPAWITAAAPVELGAAPGARAHIRLAASILVLGVATVATCLAARDEETQPPRIASTDDPAEHPAKPEPAESPADGGSETSPNASPSARELAASPQAAQATLEKLGALRGQKMAEALGLSEAQKLEVSRLLGELSSNLSRLRAANTVRGRAARVAKIGVLIAAAEDRVAEILNAEQRLRWQSEP